MSVTLHELKSVLDATPGLNEIARLAFNDLNAGQYLWDQRYLPPTRAEWRRRVEELIAGLRSSNPCGCVLSVEVGSQEDYSEEREYFCAEGVIIRTADADQAPLSGEWHGIWGMDNYPEACTVDEALAELRVGGGALLRADNRPAVANALAEQEPIMVIGHTYEADLEADPPDPYLDWHGYNVSPEARLWFGLSMEPAPESHDPCWEKPLTGDAVLEMNNRHSHWQTFSHSLNGLNDDLMELGFNPLTVFADLLELGLADPKSANFWHPHIYALA